MMVYMIRTENKLTEYMSKDGNEYIRGNVRVEWVDLGEGLSGDYNPDDPSDVRILRFDISVHDGGDRDWYDPGDASYATRFPADADIQSKKMGLKAIMDRVYDHASEGLSVKKVGEEMSWLCLEDVRPTPHYFFISGVITSTCFFICFILGIMLSGIGYWIFGTCLMILAFMFIPQICRSFQLDGSAMKIKQAYPQP